MGYEVERGLRRLRTTFYDAKARSRGFHNVMKRHDLSDVKPGTSPLSVVHPVSLPSPYLSISLYTYLWQKGGEGRGDFVDSKVLILFYFLRVKNQGGVGSKGGEGLGGQNELPGGVF
jgi:hypothetical protein